MKQLVINRMNNMGDALCQMRGLKEYKERTGNSLDFVTCHWLHYCVANHTDIFDNVLYDTGENINGWGNGWQSKGYDGLIEFTVDWQNACDNTILRAWTEKTLGFVPTDPRPYFLVTQEEKIVANAQYNFIMESLGLRKSVMLQLQSVSCDDRGFLREDWNKVIAMFPEDVAIFYTCPINWAVDSPLQPRRNLILLPGYPLGTMGALLQKMDAVFTVHSGTVMLAYAVDAKPIIHINFLSASGSNILKVPVGENILISDNRSVDWNQLQLLITEYLWI